MRSDGELDDAPEISDFAEVHESLVVHQVAQVRVIQQVVGAEVILTACNTESIVKYNG